MVARQGPSSDMLHSVGALMDTSFIRAAVADANEAGGPRPAGAAHRHLRWLARVQAVLMRWSRPSR